jgi:single-stranded-DNA-specific exonuclease
LVGLAKYLARTHTPVSRSQLMERLTLTPLSLDLGLTALSQSGFGVDLETEAPGSITLQPETPPEPMARAVIHHFLEAVEEEQFRRRYFAQASATTLATAGR